MAAATAAPSTGGTYNGPLPGSGAYGIFQAQAQTAYENAMAQIANQRTSLLSQAGFGGNYDPTTGAFQGVSGPLANAPAGDYQQMMLANSQQHASDAAAAAGLGFKGGLAQQAMERSQQATGLNASNFATQFAQKLSGLTDQETNQTTSYQNSLVQEMLNEVQNGIANQAFNPGNPGALGPTPAAPAAFTPPPAVLGRTALGAPIYGYGKQGRPFLTIAGAKAAGRLGVKKGG